MRDFGQLLTSYHPYLRHLTHGQGKAVKKTPNLCQSSLIEYAKKVFCLNTLSFSLPLSIYLLSVNNKLDFYKSIIQSKPTLLYIIFFQTYLELIRYHKKCCLCQWSSEWTEFFTNKKGCPAYAAKMHLMVRLNSKISLCLFILSENLFPFRMYLLLISHNYLKL